MDTCPTVDTCPICLEDINPNHIIKQLSCNHKFHFCCFKKLVYNHGNMFIDCPLCRQMNTDTNYPLKDNYKKNILLMCNSGVTKVRCNHMTKKGSRCKLKSHIMNYGKCHIHNTDILPKDKYKLFCKYLYYILQTNYRWMSLIHLLDLGKKVIIHKLNKNDGLEKILHYLYLFLNKGLKDGPLLHMNQIFRFYDFEEPSDSWIDYCLENKTII